MASPAHREARHGLAGRVDRILPFLAGASALAAVLITALSGVPVRLPGIALDSTPLFLVERGGAVVAALIIVTALLGRTLNRELPIGFSTPTGSLTYAKTAADATTSSDMAVADLVKRLDKQGADFADLRHTVGRLTETFPPGR